MTISSLGRMDAYCTACQQTVIVDTTLVCPGCGAEVDRRSLPVSQKVAATMGRQAPSDATAGPSRRQVSLPATREALAWDRATDALVAALEAEEEAARLAYEAAKERAQAARQAAHDMRQLRSLVVVEQPTRALAAPKKQPGQKPRRADAPAAPVAVQGEIVEPKPAGSAPPERPWSRMYPACINCGTTGTRQGTTTHAAKGRCFLCYAYVAKHGTERPSCLWAGGGEQ